MFRNLFHQPSFKSSKDFQTLKESLDQYIREADDLYNKGNYFEAYGKYKIVFNTVDQYAKGFSNTFAYELLWCRSGMYACNRATKTVSVNQAIFDLYYLQQDLNKYSNHLDSETVNHIQTIITHANRYYISDINCGINCANADYDYAVNVGECVNKLSTVSHIDSLRELITIPKAHDKRFKMLESARFELSKSYHFYQKEGMHDTEKNALYLLAQLCEYMADDLIDSHTHSLNQLNDAIGYYHMTLNYLKMHHTIPSIDLHLSILCAHAKIIDLCPYLAEEQHRLMAQFIRSDITADVLRAIPHEELNSKKMELKAYKKIAGVINQRVKRTLTQSDSLENIYDAPDDIASHKNKKPRIDATGLAENSMYKSDDATSESASLSSDTPSRPISPKKR